MFNALAPKDANSSQSVFVIFTVWSLSEIDFIWLKCEASLSSRSCPVQNMYFLKGFLEFGQIFFRNFMDFQSVCVFWDRLVVLRDFGRIKFVRIVVSMKFPFKSRKFKEHF